MNIRLTRVNIHISDNKQQTISQIVYINFHSVEVEENLGSYNDFFGNAGNPLNQAFQLHTKIDWVTPSG